MPFEKHRMFAITPDTLCRDSALRHFRIPAFPRSRYHAASPHHQRVEHL
jgi:hypothetical protein